jgi:hypothetical protein
MIRRPTMGDFWRWLLSWVIPDTRIPPAASEYDDELEKIRWSDRSHNSTLLGIVNTRQATILQEVDLKAKERYDNMDRHVRTLRELKVKIQERKASRKRRKRLKPVDPDPNPAT